MDFRTITKLKRFKDIVLILLKYGFEDMVDRLDLPAVGPLEPTHRAGEGLGTYERIRHALEDLGPTFVKFGQIMSLRPDLLPQPLIRELTGLQDDVRPEGFETVRDRVEREMQKPVGEAFNIFDPTPVAAASLSQVHRGVLRDDGAIVAVKVQRPGIRKKVEQDLDILEAVVQRLHARLEEARIYDLPGLVKITRRTLLNELDFTREARHMKIARMHQGDHRDVYIPEVLTPFCTRNLLVMEYIQGARLKNISPESLPEAEELARGGLRSSIRQILEHGFFHADPHPGNILITEASELCLLDWGMVGRLTREARYELVDLIHAVVDRDTERLVSALLMIARSEKDVDRRSLERDLLDILDAHFALPLKELRIGQLLLDITTLLREYKLRLPSDLGIMIKALLTAEGSARHIYPDLDVVSEAEPHVKRIAEQRFKPSRLWRTFHAKLSQLLAFQGRMPRLFSQIIDKVDRGHLSIRFEHENLEGLQNTLENIFNRLTFGVIIGALIIGSSMIITTGIGPLLFGFPLLGLLGYLISAVLGLWLVYNIIRSRRY
jgi:ubiquinone biosynthesis protein